MNFNLSFCVVGLVEYICILWTSSPSVFYVICEDSNFLGGFK